MRFGLAQLAAPLALQAFLGATPTVAATPATARTHDVGNLHLTVTDRGTFGSRPGAGAPTSDLPSAEWPAGSGIEHLFEAGIWFAGVENGIARVTTSLGPSELRPVDVGASGGLYDQHDPTAASTRYPDAGSDDDGDGFDDEDPVDGIDNDGDGLVDEDGGAIGDQHFRVVLGDDDPAIFADSPDHDPLHIRIALDTFQWSNVDYDDFVGFEIAVTNVGATWIRSPQVGFYVDPDIGARTNSSRERGDLPGLWRGVVTIEDGSRVPVSLAYAYDADGDDGAAPGYFGVLLVSENWNLDISPEHQTLHAVASFEWYDKSATEKLPQNDAARFDILQRELAEPAPAHGDFRRQGDTAFVVATRANWFLESEGTLVVRGAFVVGAGEDELRANAVKAVIAAYGSWFDRDADGTTGVFGRELRICETDFGPPGSWNPIYRTYQDCVDSTDLMAPNPLKPIAQEQLDSEGCIYVDGDCLFERLRGFPECNELTGLLPSEYLGCTGVDGREYQLRWITQTPARPPRGEITLQERDGGVQVFGRFENIDASRLLLRRDWSVQLPAAQWGFDRFTAINRSGEIDFFDSATGGWPRIYELVRLSDNGESRLDRKSISRQSGPGGGDRDRIFVFPSPANPMTTIRYHLDAPSMVQLEVVDLRGRRVRILVHEPRPAGDNQVRWRGVDDQGREVASGPYFVRFRAEGFEVARKLMVIR